MYMIFIRKSGDTGNSSNNNGDTSDNNLNASQPGLDACGASLNSPGRLVLSDFIRPVHQQMVLCNNSARRC